MKLIKIENNGRKLYHFDNGNIVSLGIYMNENQEETISITIYEGGDVEDNKMVFYLKPNDARYMYYDFKLNSGCLEWNITKRLKGNQALKELRKQPTFKYIKSIIALRRAKINRVRL